MTDAEKLLSKIKTLNQGEDIIHGLEALAASKKAKDYISFEVLNTLDTFGKIASYSGLLTDFKKLFYKTQTVSITLAFNPSKEFLERLIKWFEDNLGKRVILDVKVDPGLIAGAQVLCKEHFRDYTVRRKMEEQGVLQ